MSYILEITPVEVSVSVSVSVLHSLPNSENGKTKKTFNPMWGQIRMG